jgi:hypothetical protein
MTGKSSYVLVSMKSMALPRVSMTEALHLLVSSRMVLSNADTS